MKRYARWVLAVVMFVGLGAALTAVPDEAAVVAPLTAADHEAEEGYFTIGEGATVIARPGSDLHRWLTAHRGQKVRLGIGLSKGTETQPDQQLGRSSDRAR